MKKLLAALLCVLVAGLPVTSALAGVALPSGLTVIESEAFEGDKSINGLLTLPSNVKSIGDEAFKDTNLYALWLPTGIRYIGDNVLENTDAVYAVVPSASVELAENSLTGVEYIIAANKAFGVYDWADSHGVPCYAVSEVSWHNNFCYEYRTGDGSEAKLLFAKHDGISGSVTIPEYMDGFRVTEIGPHAFTRLYGVTEINLPETAELPEEKIDWPNATINFYEVGVDAVIPEDAEEIPMAESAKVLNVGDEYYPWFDDEVLPGGELRWEWESSDDEVATVDEEGRVEAIGLGSAAITATLYCEDGCVYYGVCAIEVKEPAIELEIYEDIIEIPVGRIEGVTYYYVADGLWDNVVLSVESSDESVAAPYQTTGFIGVGAGTATLTFKAELNGAAATDTVLVKVYEPELELSDSNLYTYTGFEYTLELQTEIPDGAMVKWTSDDEGIATVDDNGNVEIHSPGNTNIVCTVIYPDNTTKSADCVVRARDMQLEWSYEEVYELTVGEPAEMETGVEHNIWTVHREEIEKTAKMTSSDESVVSFGENGPIAHKAGTAMITAEVTVQGYTARVTFLCIVHDGEEDAEYVGVDDPTVMMNIGDWHTPWLSVELPGDCEWFWNWESSDKSVAVVDEAGHVEAVGLGEAIITGTVKCGENGEYGIYTGSVLVKVVEPYVELYLYKDYLYLPVGAEHRMEYDVYHTGRGELTIELEAENGEIAEGRYGNFIAALKSGVTTVTMTIGMNGATDSKTFTLDVFEPELVLSEHTCFTYEGWEHDLRIESELNMDEVNSIEWWSDDNEVAQVDENGHVTIVRGNDGDWATICCTVTMKDGTVYEDGCVYYTDRLEWNWHDWPYIVDSMSVGDELYLMPCDPAYIHAQHEEFYSMTIENMTPDIATSDKDGVVTAHKAGTAYFKATQQLFDLTDERVYAVVVSDYESNIQRVEMGDPVLTMNVGEEYQLWMNCDLPGDCEHVWTWESSLEEGITVDENGVVKAESLGEAIITATVVCGENGECGTYQASSLVRVQEPYLELFIHEDPIVIPVGREYWVPYDVHKNAAGEYSYWHETADETIAKREHPGYVTGISAGTTTLTGYATVNGNTVSKTVTVEVYEPELVLSESNIFTYTGWEHDLSIETELDWDEVESVEWWSEDDWVATVDEEGHVRAGDDCNMEETTIVCEVTMKDGTKLTGDCVIEVIEWRFGWQDDAWDPKYMNVGETQNLRIGKTRVHQHHTGELEFTMTSSDESIVSVDPESYAVTAHKAGTVLMTAKQKLFDAETEISFIICVSDENVTTVPMNVPDSNVNPEDSFEVWLEWELPDCDYIWTYESSDANVAAIEERDGGFWVDAKNVGDATITLTVECGENGEHGVFTAQGFVHVGEPWASITLEETEITVPVGRTSFVNYDYDWFGMEDNLSIRMESADESIVDDDLMAVGEGTTTVAYILSLHDFEARAEVTVHVYKPELTLNYVDRHTFTGFEEKLEVLDELPEGAKIEWRSENENVFTIDNEGNVYACGEGDAAAVCTVTYPDGTVKTADCIVRVIEWMLYWDENGDQTMVYGETRRIHPNVWMWRTPQHDPDVLCTVTITSSDESIVSIGEDRQATAHKPGEATIYCHAEYLGRTADYEFIVFVEEPYINVWIDNSYEEMNVDDNNRYVNVHRDTNGQVTKTVYTSSDENVVKVTSHGLLIPVGEGEAQITCTVYVGEYSNSAEMTVRIHGYHATLTPNELTLKKGEMATLSADIDGGLINYHNRGFWSSNDAVASVNGEGYVIANGAGTALIYFASDTDHGRIEASAVVHVVDDEAKIKLNASSIELNIGESYQLEAFDSKGKKLENVEWYSNNMHALIVDDTGKVTMINWWMNEDAETVYCKATIDGEEVVASCMVRHNGSPVCLNTSQAKALNVGDSQDVWYEVSCTDPELEYVVGFVIEDEKIASVDSNNGRFTVNALAEGETKALLYAYDAETKKTLTMVEVLIFVGEELPRYEDAFFEYDWYVLATEGMEGSEQWLNLFCVPDAYSEFYGFEVTSSDESVVSIRDRHMATGHNAGKATVTLHVNDHPELTDTAEVYVFDVEYAINGVMAEDEQYHFNAGDEITITVNGIPEDYPKHDIYWNYDQDRLSFVSETDNQITLRARRHGETWMDVSVDLYSNRGEGWGFPIFIDGDGNDYLLSTRDANMNPGEDFEIWTEFGWQNIQWRSTDESVAKVIDDDDDHGRVNIEAVGLGTCEIIAECTLEDGKTTVTATADIRVNEREWKLIDNGGISEVMALGRWYNLYPYIECTGWHNPEVTWTFSDPSFGTINDRNDFCPEKTGTFTLTITASEGEQVESLSMDITVVEPIVRMEGDYTTLRPNQTQQLTLIPKTGMEIESVEWRTSDANLVTVDQEGNIAAAHHEGRALITADVTFTDGSAAVAVCYVDLIPDWDVYLNADAYSDCEGMETYENRDLWINIDTNAAPEEIQFNWWIDENDGIAAIEPILDENGNEAFGGYRVVGANKNTGETWVHCNVQVVANGEVIHTRDFHWRIEVWHTYFSIDPDQTEYTVRAGENGWINWNVGWDRYDVGEWVYSSSDESVAIATRDGNVFGVAPGEATITCTYYQTDGSEIASASVDVTVTGAKVSVSQTEVTLAQGESIMLTGTVDFNGLEDHGSYWETSNDQAVVVDNNGTVYAVSPGTAYVYFRQNTNDGEYSAYCEVTVTGDQPEFTLNKTAATLYDRQQLQLEIVTELGEPDRVEWNTNNGGHIWLDENGLITANADGNADRTGVVYCTAWYGEVACTATCQIMIPTPTFGLAEWHFGEGHWMQLDEVGHWWDFTDALRKTDDSIEVELEYWSDDESIAYFEGEHRIVAAGEGETFVHIRASAESGETYTWDRLIRVGWDNPAITKAEMCHDLFVVDTFNRTERHLDMNIEPGYTGYSTTYSSRNADIAGVREDGHIYAVNPGSTIIDVTLTDDHGNVFNLEANVLVLGEMSISAENGETTFHPGDQVQLTLSNADVITENGGSIEWWQGHGNVWLDENGLLTIGNRGTEELDLLAIVRFPDGYDCGIWFVYNVDADSPYFYFTVGDASRNLIAYEGCWLIRIDQHSNAWDDSESTVYESEDEGVAKVVYDENGQPCIECVGQGETVITATMLMNDGSTIVGTLPVTIGEVQAPVVYCMPERTVVHVDETVGTWLDWAECPFNIGPDHYYTSSNENVLTCWFDDNGWHLTGVAVGEVQVTVHANYGEMATEHSITIYVIE